MQKTNPNFTSRIIYGVEIFLFQYLFAPFLHYHLLALDGSFRTASRFSLKQECQKNKFYSSLKNVNISAKVFVEESKTSSSLSLSYSSLLLSHKLHENTHTKKSIEKQNC